MNTKNFFLVLGAGILIALILFTCNCKKTVKPAAVIPVKEQLKKVEKNETDYQLKADSMAIVINKITEDRKELRSKLKASQEQTKRLGEILLKPVINSTPGTIDEHQEPEQATKDLVESARLSDSLCNQTITNLESQITGQNKLAGLKDSLYFQLRQSFNIAIDQQQLLTTNNRYLAKKVRNKKIQTFFWKAAAVAGGVFILKTAIK